MNVVPVKSVASFVVSKVIYDVNILEIFDARLSWHKVDTWELFQVPLALAFILLGLTLLFYLLLLLIRRNAARCKRVLAFVRPCPASPAERLLDLVCDKWDEKVISDKHGRRWLHVLRLLGQPERWVLVAHSVVVLLTLVPLFLHWFNHTISLLV